MEQNAPWEAKSSSTSQEIPHILQNLKVHYHIYKSPPLLPVMRQINPIHASYRISWKFNFLFPSYLCLGHPSVIFPSGYLTRTLCAPLLYPLHATCPISLNHLDFITQILFGEEYRSWSSSLCSLLQSPAACLLEILVVCKSSEHLVIDKLIIIFYFLMISWKVLEH